jgi:hypothetical protein
MAESESTPDPARAVAEGRGSDKSGHMHMPMGRNLPRPDGVSTKRRSVEDDHVDTSLYRRAHLHDGQRCRVRYGAVTVLSIPALSAYAAYLLPIVVALSFAISPFIAWEIAPTLRSKWQREHAGAA